MFGVSRPLAIITSLLVLFASESVLLQWQGNPFAITNIQPLSALTSALISIHMMRLVFVRQRLDSRYMMMSGEALRILRYLGPTLLAAVMALFCTLFITYIGSIFGSWLAASTPDLQPLPALWLKLLVSHIFWLIGIHGDHMHQMLFNRDSLALLYMGNLSYKELLDTFIIFGGSGACLSLLLALLITKQPPRFRKLAAIATPFTLFNISELLIYGLPIVFNRYLIVPFLAVPFINLAIATSLLPYLNIHFVDISIPWITPTFLNAYLVTGGDASALLLQVFLIILGTLCYLPFLRRYGQHQQIPNAITNIYTKLNMLSHLENHERLQFWRNQADQEESRWHIYSAFDLLHKNDLQLYFQPLVNPYTGQCEKLETLIRLQGTTGNIPPSELLDALETTRLATTVDFWVIQTLATMLRNESLPDNVIISININPTTLLIDAAIEHIISSMQGLPVGFEVLEHRQADSQTIQANLHRLKQAGFEIGIDDFGSGYSNLTSLSFDTVSFIKLDRSLMVGATQSEQGNILFSNICHMVKNLGHQLIVEGVENPAQLNLAISHNVDLIQGWYYSAALPWHEALEYASLNDNRRIK